MLRIPPPLWQLHRHTLPLLIQLLPTPHHRSLHLTIQWQRLLPRTHPRQHTLTRHQFRRHLTPLHQPPMLLHKPPMPPMQHPLPPLECLLTHLHQQHMQHRCRLPHPCTCTSTRHDHLCAILHTRSSGNSNADGPFDDRHASVQLCSTESSFAKADSPCTSCQASCHQATCQEETQRQEEEGLLLSQRFWRVLGTVPDSEGILFCLSAIAMSLPLRHVLIWPPQ